MYDDQCKQPTEQIKRKKKLFQENVERNRQEYAEIWNRLKTHIEEREYVKQQLEELENI